MNLHSMRHFRLSIEHKYYKKNYTPQGSQRYISHDTSIPVVTYVAENGEKNYMPHECSRCPECVKSLL
ncbi:Hypothetical predicted protein, partial [Pelobates cultripes]